MGTRTHVDARHGQQPRFSLSDLGKMQEAEALYRRALDGFEKALGPEHTSTLREVKNLGRFYRYQGKMEEAETMYRRAGEPQILARLPKSQLVSVYLQALHDGSMAEPSRVGLESYSIRGSIRSLNLNDRHPRTLDASTD